MRERLVKIGILAIGLVGLGIILYWRVTGRNMWAPYAVVLGVVILLQLVQIALERKARRKLPSE